MAARVLFDACRFAAVITDAAKMHGTEKDLMKNRAASFLVLSALLAAAGVLAGPTLLPLRSESGTCIYRGSTTQTIETVFGTNAVILPFAATTTYDFFSPPLKAPTDLTTADRASGVVVMKNLSTAAANDFTASARMEYFDYDPSSGGETLIVATTESGSAVVKHGKTANWSLPKTFLPADSTIPT